jgi:hypothetical protein
VIFWTFLGNEVEVRKMTHRTLLKMMKSTYPEPLSVFFWRTLYTVYCILNMYTYLSFGSNKLQ